MHLINVFFPGQQPIVPFLSAIEQTAIKLSRHLILRGFPLIEGIDDVLVVIRAGPGIENFALSAVTDLLRYWLLIRVWNSGGGCIHHLVAILVVAIGHRVVIRGTDASHDRAHALSLGLKIDDGTC